MTYQEALTQEINSLPPALLTEVFDFVLFLKIKAQSPDEQFSEKVRELQFQQELKALSQAYRARLAKEGKLDQTPDEVMADLKQTREKIAAAEYESPAPSVKAWSAFRALGKNAKHGKLPNAAVEHDRYLYGK